MITNILVVTLALVVFTIDRVMALNLWLNKAMKDAKKIALRVCRESQKKSIRVEGKVIESISAYKCPLTKRVMEEPVLSPFGHCFEKAAIEKWLSAHKSCPLTGRLLMNSQLKPCLALKQAISQTQALFNI